MGSVPWTRWPNGSRPPSPEDGEHEVSGEGVIEETLPRGLYRVRCQDGRRVTATLSTRARQVTVAVLPGDRVKLQISPYDPSRGRITEKLA
ncbi:MAG: translation initiation factor IF-1 [Myxococcota bacterium]